MKKAVITGSQGIAHAVSHVLSADYNVINISKSNGYDIADVGNWASEFVDYDVCINCAYDSWLQVNVLEEFCNIWNSKDKTIVSIGSTVSDYGRTEKHLDHQHFPYRLHKQALQNAFNRLVMSNNSNLKIINPGITNTRMVSHIESEKLSTELVANHIKMLIESNELKRIDLWV